MRSFPPEVDQLMWAVAEDGRDSAIQEFAGRYPQFRGELMRRVNLVTGLKRQSRPVRQEIPAFVVRETRPMFNKNGLAVVGALSFAALAAAAYTASVLLRHPDQPDAEFRLPHINKPFLRGPSPASSAKPMDVPQVPPVTASSRDTTPATSEAGIQPAYMRTQTRIAMKDASLVMVIQAIADEGKMKLEIGPGFVDQTVSVDYQNISPLEALQAMAKEHGFTILDEGNGHFLAVPAVDAGGTLKQTLQSGPTGAGSP